MQSILDILTEKERSKILSLTRVESYQKGADIIREGESGEQFFIIGSGRVLISKKIKEGEKKTLAVLEKGDFFGEMSLMAGGPYSADATAMEEVSAYLIDHKDFSDMLKGDYETASRFLSAIIKITSERFRSTNEELVALYETGRIIGSSESLNDVLSRTLSVLLSVTQAQCGLFVLANQFTGQLEIKESTGISDIDSGLMNDLMKSAMGTLAGDVDGNERFRGKIKADGKIAAFISSPLKIKEKDLGLIILCKKDTGTFTREKLNLLTAVAGQIATAVENALMNEEARDRSRLGRKYITY